jgi:transcriptional regulator with XRE-family HTH domain
MNDTQAAQLGRKLATARRNLSLSLREVAERAGVTFMWLWRVEHGTFNHPHPERLSRVIEVLGVDPERIDRITKGHVSSNLPGLRTYFRAKYNLSPADIEQIERTVTDLQRKHRKEAS